MVAAQLARSFRASSEGHPGSAASTLIPATVQKAEHVTMLQRSSSYYYAPPITHELAVQLRALDIPDDWTHENLRRQYISQYQWLARTSLEAPDELHNYLIEEMRPLLPEGFDIEKHFTPRYRPWQQRIAIVPEGDLFASLRVGKASIVTDTIETFTEKGILVSSGEDGRDPPDTSSDALSRVVAPRMAAVAGAVRTVVTLVASPCR
jgi:cation diffusion facilitator CzcD-associated flavoprotein CzcO